MNITTELAQAILNYLASKPYAEVFRLVEELTKQINTQPKPEVKPEAKPETKNYENTSNKK